MRRIQLFEFEDQKWLPEIIRNCITDLLYFGTNSTNIYKVVLPIIEKGLEKSNEKVLIDLCSGSSGGIVKINEELMKRCLNHYNIILTDLYPNTATLEDVATKAPNIDYVRSPVDATSMPRELKGFRTFFASFHHFQPRDAKKILISAVESRTPIGVFEFTERSLLDFIAVITLHALLAFVFTPFIRPFRLGRLILTYIVPIVPLCYVWDGVISVLRSYKPEELRQMAGEINVSNYTWEIGRRRLNPIAHVVYLLGCPNG